MRVAILIIALACVGCVRKSPAEIAATEAADAEVRSVAAAGGITTYRTPTGFRDVHVWTDPETGCEFYMVSVDGGYPALNQPRFNPDGTQRCKLRVAAEDLRGAQ